MLIVTIMVIITTSTAHATPQKGQTPLGNAIESAKLSCLAPTSRESETRPPPKLSPRYRMALARRDPYRRFGGQNSPAWVAFGAGRGRVCLQRPTAFAGHPALSIGLQHEVPGHLRCLCSTDVDLWRLDHRHSRRSN